jgi:hypothetical protein
MGHGVTRAVPRTALLLTSLLLSSLPVAGCRELDFRDNEPAPLHPKLWTLFEMLDALNDNKRVAESPTFPQGFDTKDILTSKGDGSATLKIIPAYSEGEPAAYVLTEIWIGFREIWVQPWYFLVSAWNEKTPGMNRAKDQMGVNYPAIWEVHPKSLFYSPFWQVYYALLPPGVDAWRYTSGEQIINDKLPLYLGPPFIYSARPAAITVEMPAVHPYLNTPVATFLNSTGMSFVDNEKIPYLTQGSNTFKYDANLVVEEVPMFLFVRRNSTGGLVHLNAPNVIGTGPLFARRPPDAPGGRPRFGSHSRYHLAIVPATAAAFEPERFEAATQSLTDKMLDPRAYRGRVATNAVRAAEGDPLGCFEDMTRFPAGCTWLDSQARIEDALGLANLQKTEISVCSTVVFYGGKGIGR